ncbi:hypothetical protein EVAR_70887_1 [Eumeta japonica]|uniref:Uncharacterized protein n=1 Tax=Eumeta variegata TaxID=151549 RepID=A0A4C1T6C3_EUMVA|nr:hypothetical protein EVAR_70887_1 [Eumeta japonica]
MKSFTNNDILVINELGSNFQNNKTVVGEEDDLDKKLVRFSKPELSRVMGVTPTTDHNCIGRAEGSNPDIPQSDILVDITQLRGICDN